MPARVVRMHGSDPVRTDEEIQGEFDALMVLACNGDRRALGAIAIALTPALLGAACAELGRLERYASGVVADALTMIADGAGDFDSTHERATVWLERFVRKIARAHLARLVVSRTPSLERGAPSRRARARHAERRARRNVGRREERRS